MATWYCLFPYRCWLLQEWQMQYLAGHHRPASAAVLPDRALGHNRVLLPQVDRRGPL